MDDLHVMSEQAATVECRVKGLAEAEAARLRNLTAVLPILIDAEECDLASAEVLARTRGMKASVAAELSVLQGSDRKHDLSLTNQALAHCAVFVRFAQAQAMEYLVGRRLAERLGLDPAFPPVVQTLLNEHASELAPLVMTLLTEQARFVQATARMECPVGHLPVEVFDAVLRVWRQASEGTDAIAKSRVESELRREYDESRTRIALTSRVAQAISSAASIPLSLDMVGLSLFLSMLADRLELPRASVVALLDRSQQARLYLAMIAAGMSRERAVQQLLMLHETVDDTALEPIARSDADRLTRLYAAWPGEP